MSDNKSSKIKECRQGNMECVFLHHFLTDDSSNSINVNLPTEQDLRNKNLFRFNSINCKDIDKIIYSLKIKYSSGYDSVPISFIERSKKRLLKTLTHLINSPFITGIFPESFKITKLIPIHKRKCKMDIANYGPVVSLPALSKIYEWAISNQNMNELAGKKELDNLFSTWFQTSQVSSDHYHRIHWVIDFINASEKTVGIFLDLGKAFDSVSHEVLLQRLHNLGVPNLANKWLKFWLHFQYQSGVKCKQNIKYEKNCKRCKDVWFKGQDKLKPNFFGAINLLGKILIIYQKPYANLSSIFEE